jgi:hypothetical protein
MTQEPTRLSKFRRTYLINKEFQLKFCMFLMIPILLSQLIFWICIEYFFHKMISLGQSSNLPVGHPFYSFISVQKNDLTMIVLFASIALAFCIFIWGIVLSHRISGPLYHLKKYMDDSSAETIKSRPLRFRKGDFFQELPGSFNNFVKKITDKT